MQRRDISNAMGLAVAIDLDALITHPSGRVYSAYRWLNRPWFRRLYVVLQPFYLRKCRLSEEAEKIGWWFLTRLTYQITVIVRRPYTAGLTAAVEAVLDDFPAPTFHLIQASSDVDAGSAISSYCRTRMIVRFFTTDVDLARFLPSSLVKVVSPRWDEDVLR